MLGVLIGAGILAGCGDGGGTTPGPQVLRYRRFANAPAGQTITDVLAAAPVAGQMFVIFTTDTGDVYGTIGPGLATAATAPQRLLDLAPGTAVTADAAEVRLGRVAFVLAADNTLHAGVWTVLPTSTTQYTFGPVVEVSAGDDLPALGDVDLIAEPSFARAFLVYTTTDDPDVTADPRVQLRVVGLDGLIDGIPRPVSLAASTPGVPGEFALSTTTRWSGEILGGFVGPGGDVRILLGQQSEAGTQLGTPAVRTIAAGRLNPVEGVNVFDPVRITSHTFFPPPEVEPCDEGDGLFHRDEWLVSPHAGTLLAITEVTERKFNCPTDPDQLLFEGTRWVIASPDHNRLVFDERPLAVVNGADDQLFVLSDDGEQINAFNADTLASLGRLEIDGAPSSLEVDHLVGIGGENVQLIRLVGHTGDAIWVAESGV